MTIRNHAEADAYFEFKPKMEQEWPKSYADDAMHPILLKNSYHEVTNNVYL